MRKHSYLKLPRYTSSRISKCLVATITRGTSFIHPHHSRVWVWIMIASSRSSVSGLLLVVDGFHRVSVDESHPLHLPSFTFLGRANNFRAVNFSVVLLRWISELFPSTYHYGCGKNPCLYVCFLIHLMLMVNCLW